MKLDWITYLWDGSPNPSDNGQGSWTCLSDVEEVSPNVLLENLTCSSWRNHLSHSSPLQCTLECILACKWDRLLLDPTIGLKDASKSSFSFVCSTWYSLGQERRVDRGVCNILEMSFLFPTKLRLPVLGKSYILSVWLYWKMWRGS